MIVNEFVYPLSSTSTFSLKLTSLSKLTDFELGMLRKHGDLLVEALKGKK